MALTLEQYKEEFMKELKDDWKLYYYEQADFEFTDGSVAEFQDVNHVADTRWERRYEVIYKFPEGTYVAWECGIGATEMQDDSGPYSLEERKRVEETVVVVKWVKA